MDVNTITLDFQSNVMDREVMVELSPACLGVVAIVFALATGTTTRGVMRPTR